MQRWLDRIRLRLRSLFRRSTVDRDLRRELDAHVQASIDEQVAAGMSPDDARRAALRMFGNVAGIEDACRDTRGVHLLDDLVRDVGYGIRALRREPAFALVAILTLALGIGANTAIFSVFDAVMLRPLLVDHPERLVLFSGDTSTGTISGTLPEGAWSLFSSEAYEALRAANLPFQDVAAFSSNSGDVTVHVLDQDGTQAAGDANLNTHLVSGNYFDVMGVHAALGRTLKADDDRPGAAAVAVISDRYWHQLFHADPDVVGRVVRLNQVAFTIVGVTPAPFFGERVAGAPAFWVPLVWQPDIQERESVLTRPDYYWLSLIGRLGPGQTERAAEAAANVALRQFLTAKAGTAIDASTRDRIAGVRIDMVSGARGISVIREQDTKPLALLLAAAGLVLLIACANVATLLLCRATTRGTEVAVRRALGAGRGRLVRQWLTESAILAFFGATLGVLVANWTAPFLLSFFSGGPVHTALNGAVLLFSTTTALVATLVFGLAPALQAGRTDALAVLRSSGRGPRQRRRVLGVTEPFVVVQLALSLVLAIAATLCARSLFNLERTPYGFDQDILLTGINPKPGGYTVKSVGALYRRIYDTVAALPGVEGVTFARYSPFAGNRSSFGSSTVEGYTPAPDENLRLEAVEVGPNYPQTLGMPLVSGRAFDFTDTMGAAPVAMVNEAFAQRFFPTSSPLGHELRLGGGDPRQIVGVVSDAQFHGARDAMIPFVFVPILQETGQFAFDCEFEVRTRGDAATFTRTVRQAIEGVDSRVVVGRTRTLRAQVLASFGPERLAAGFVGAFALLALLLAAVGLYGVVAHGVARRTNEIGIRVALGASCTEVLWLIVRETITRLCVGIIIGVVGALAASQLLASQLFGVTTIDPLSYAAAAVGLAIVAVATSLIPATRALRVDPVTALRAE
ncbi:MAG TPA: ABC transporter permease [Vicinamibacterales bacterium]|nr:ABC transporter permease [Vicinamibacterales bacterium]